MNLKLLLLVFIMLNLTGCYTMHFVRGEQTSSVHYTHSQWYHIGALGFVGFSEPVNLTNVCDGVDRWQAVKVETGLLQSLVRGIPIPLGTFDVKYKQLSIPDIPILFLINFVYSPEQVSVACLSNR